MMDNVRQQKEAMNVSANMGGLEKIVRQRKNVNLTHVSMEEVVQQLATHMSANAQMVTLVKIVKRLLINVNQHLARMEPLA